MSTVDRALRTVEWPAVKDLRLNLLAEPAQIVFLEPTDKSIEEAVAILQEALMMWLFTRRKVSCDCGWVSWSSHRDSSRSGSRR